MRESKSGQREDRTKQEEVQVALNGNQEEGDRNKFQEVKLAEDRKTDDQEKRASFGEVPVNEMVKKQEDEGLKIKREDDKNQSEDLSEGPESERGTNDNGVQPSVTTEDKNKTQEEKSKEVGGSLQELIKQNPHHPNSVEEQQGQEEMVNAGTTVPPGPQSFAADPKPPDSQEEATTKEQHEEKQTRVPPKVMSAVARFQSQGSSQVFQVKPRIMPPSESGRPGNVLRSRENAQTPRDSDPSDTSRSDSTEEEEDRPLIKVSELKKRFEA